MSEIIVKYGEKEELTEREKRDKNRGRGRENSIICYKGFNGERKGDRKKTEDTCIDREMLEKREDGER